MRRAIVGSLILHGVLGALLLSIDRPAPAPEPRTVDIVEIVRAPLPQPPPPPPPTIVAKLEGGGGTPAPLRPKATIVHASAHTLREALGDIAIEGGTGDGGSGGGEGGGIGGGRGSGIGLGDGAMIQTIALPAPPAAPVSKARPPKLIYPKRDRTASAEELFVARVTIDRDGFVVGAKLVHRLGDHRDEQASSLIWRFRYAPALDDDGRAITATIDQPFMVGR